MISDGVVNENDDGSFYFNREASASSRPAGQFLNVEKTRHSGCLNFWISSYNHVT
jgi:hypothetical protein